MERQTYTETKTKTRIAPIVATVVFLGGVATLAALLTVTRNSKDFNILLESFKNIKSFKSVAVNLDFSIKPEARESNTVELEFPGATQDFRRQYENMFSYIPADFFINFSLQSETESLDLKTIDEANNHTKIQGEANTSGINFSVDGEFTKVKDNFYFNIRKAPFLLFFYGYDYTAIQGTWVNLSKDQIGYNSSYYSYAYDITDEKVAEYYEIFETAFDSQFITVKTPSEGTESSGLNRYVVTFDYSKYPAYIRALDKLQEKEDGYSYYNDKFFNTLEDPKNRKAIEIFSKTQNIEIFIDPTKNQIRKVIYTGKFAPPARIKKFNGKQIRINTSLSFDRTNEPINIVRPSGSISFDEAKSIMSSRNLNEIQFDRQVSNVKMIRNALSSYKENTTYGYPNTLDELLQTREDIEKKGGKKVDDSPNDGLYEYSYYYTYRNKGPFLSSVPKDVYSNRQYSYKKTGDSYELRYQVIDKPVPRSYQDYSFYFYSTYPEIIEGANTADSTHLSREGTGRTDSDNDGLSNDEETNVYFTDPNSKDTDKDSYYDGEEVKFGYNPLGPGKAGETLVEEDLKKLEEINTLEDEQAKARDSIRMNHMKEMSVLLELAEAKSSGSNVAGCVSGYSSAQLCTNEAGNKLFADFKDPSNPANICRPYGGSVCEYSISASNGYDAPKTNDYQICFYLERDTTIASAGMHNIKSGGLLRSGCQ